MAVPLQRESGQAKLHSGAHFILRGLIDSKLPDRINLAIAVAFVLGGMELVSLRCARREAVVPGELAVNFLGNFPRSTELALDKREHGDAFAKRRLPPPLPEDLTWDDVETELSRTKPSPH